MEGSGVQHVELRSAVLPQESKTEEAHFAHLVDESEAEGRPRVGGPLSMAQGRSARDDGQETDVGCFR